MNRKMFFILQLKRYLKKSPAIFGVTFITVIALSCLVYLALGSYANREEMQKIKVGMTGDIYDTYMGMGIYAIKNLDSSRFAVEFIEMTETEAKNALENHEISGYIDVPENFIKAVLRGKNIPAVYYIRKEAETFGSVIIGEITSTVSDLVVGTQKAIYSMQDIATDYGNTKKLGTVTKKLNLIYIDHILNRTEIFDTEYTGVSDSLTMGGYYTGAFCIFILLLWGISCSSVLSAKNYALCRVLAARMISPSVQILCRYLSHFAVTFLAFLFMAVLTVVVLPDNFQLIAELSGAGIGDAFLFALKLMPVIMMICAMHIAVYEAVSGTIGAILTLFTASVGMGYVCGCFYPTDFFPDAVRVIADLLPAGAGFSYIRKSMTGHFAPGELMMCIQYTLVFLAVSVMSLKIKIGGDRVC